MHPALLVVRPFLPIIGAGAIALAAWMYHNSVVNSLEKKVSDAESGLSACIDGRRSDRLNWQESEAAKLKNLLDAELEQMNERVKQEKERADANARAARRARQVTKDREAALSALSSEFGKRLSECDVADRVRGLLDDLATGTRRKDSLQSPGLPGSEAPSPSAR